MGPFAKALSLKEIAEQREATHLLGTIIEHADVVASGDGQTTFTVSVPDDFMDRLAAWDASTLDLEEDGEPDEGDETVVGEPVSVIRLRKLLYVFLSMRREGMDMTSDEVKQIMRYEY